MSRMTGSTRPTTQASRTTEQTALCVVIYRFVRQLFLTQSYHKYQSISLRGQMGAIGRSRCSTRCTLGWIRVGSCWSAVFRSS